MQGFRNWLYILIALGMIGATVAVIAVKKDNPSGSEAVATETTTYAGTITEVVFEAGACEIEIKEGESEDAVVEYENIKLSAYSASCENGVLRIKYTPTNSWNVDFLDFDDRDKDAKIVVALPADTVFEKVTMQFGAAEIKAESIQAKDLKIEVGAGEMEADYLYAKQSAVLTVGAGALYADHVKLTNADLNCGVGEMELTGEIYGDSLAECGVGEITLSLTMAEELYRGSLDCGLGEISVGRTSVEGSGKKEYGTSSAENRMDIKCGIGEVDVRFD